MSKMVSCVIDSVRVSLTNQQRVVVLKEQDNERYLPIWIGLYEAEAITISLQHIEVARPQTHDLICSILKNLDAKCLFVEITALREDVFYANLVTEQNETRKFIDCRPSDALALATRLDVPIYVSEDVLTAAGIEPERDIRDQESSSDSPIDESEEDLSIFKDFLDTLGKDQSQDDTPSRDD